jgi:hypothetical protein
MVPDSTVLPTRASSFYKYLVLSTPAYLVLVLLPVVVRFYPMTPLNVREFEIPNKTNSFD